MLIVDFSTEVFTESQTVDSSFIDKIFYDRPAMNLYVKFQNGTVTKYTNVEVFVYENFCKAVSPGSFYVSYIKGKYGSESVDTTLSLRDIKEVTQPTTEAGKPADLYEYSVEVGVAADSVVNAARFAEAAGFTVISVRPL